MSHFFQPPVEREVNEKLEFHLEMRTRELVANGMDPGATPGALIRLVFGRSALVAGIEWAVGVVASIAVAGALEGLLFGTSRYDLLAFGAATVLLAALTLGAGWPPARSGAGGGGAGRIRLGYSGRSDVGACPGRSVSLRFEPPLAASASGGGLFLLALGARLQVRAAPAQLLEQAGTLNFPPKLLQGVFDAFAFADVDFDHPEPPKDRRARPFVKR